MAGGNLCFSENVSCSACCGINNINLNQREKKKWLISNTNNFIKVNLHNRGEVLSFRETGERFLKNKMIRPDVYTCPFLGFVNQDKLLTGCLLHNGGSPHPQIHLISSPQQFSFYGENICQTYNCLNKQDILAKFKVDNLLIANKAIMGNSLVYSKAACNHNLLAVFQKLVKHDESIVEKLESIVIKKLEETEIPVTSFEMLLTLEFFNEKELWHVLGTLFTKDGYIFNAYHITPAGILIGERIRKTVS